MLIVYVLTISNFDKNVKIVKNIDNKIVVKNNGKEINVTKEAGKYKLHDSAYKCEN